MDLDLPLPLLEEIDALVAMGQFASRDAAILELIRIGLESVKARRRSPPAPPLPPRPPMPPGVVDPHIDEPISVDPTRDVQEF